MPPTLDHYFTLRAYFDGPNIVNIGAVKGGPQRIVVPLHKGFLKSSKSDLTAELLPGSGDWFLLNTTTSPPTGHINVRLQLRTPTGSHIYVHYDGMMKVDELCQAAVVADFSTARTTRYGEHELFATPIMETSDAEWKWVESSVWVAEGRWVVENETVAIEYEVYLVRKSEV